MLRYLVFAPLGADPANPMILGAVEVPGCFTPTDAFIDAAEARGMDLFIMTGPPDAVPSHLMGVGKQLLERVRTDPRIKAHLN